MNGHSTSSPPCLPLVWTVGFSGKRFLTPGQERIASQCLPTVLSFLEREAAKHHARLTAVSSIARGGDVLFAEACLARKGNAPRIPWRCLLPFEQADFSERDLAAGMTGDVLDDGERRTRLAKAQSCLSRAYSVENVSPTQDLKAHLAMLRSDASDELKQPAKTAIDAAYLECGCRTVDESDAMVFLLRPDEFEAFCLAHEAWVPEMHEWEKQLEQWKHDWQIWRAQVTLLKEQCGCKGPFADEPVRPVRPVHRPQLPGSMPAGTAALALYALAARRPCLMLNAEDPDACENALKIIQHETGKHSRAHTLKPKPRWFVDPMITEHIEQALTTKVGDHELPSHQTRPRQFVEHLLRALDQMACKHQGETQGGLQRMLILHLLASCVAAIFATVLDLQNDHWEVIWKSVAWGLVVISIAKPVMAYAAMRLEHRLDHHRSRTKWVECRILAEVCRSALAQWDLPEQPMDAIDEEDFPKLKRLIRSLRLLRTLDDDIPKFTDPVEHEKAMSEASLRYARDRLEGQAHYFQTSSFKAKKEENYWHTCFKNSLRAAIAAGLALVIIEVIHASHAGRAADGHHGFLWPFEELHHWLQAVCVVAPFMATYALGMIAVRDCRRRVQRYEEMRHYLTRLAHTLRLCRAGPSRLRLIEHAERMMIEEQHEWFSVTRNYSV